MPPLHLACRLTWTEGCFSYMCRSPLCRQMGASAQSSPLQSSRRRLRKGLAAEPWHFPQGISGDLETLAGFATQRTGGGFHSFHCPH